MAAVSKHSLTEKYRYNQSKNTGLLRYIIPVWFILLLAGLWITRVDVQNVPPPGGYFAGGNLPGTAGDYSQITDYPKDPMINELRGVHRAGRYANIEISDAELYELASVVFLEASTQSMEGQQAVAEVVLNRVVAKNFPNTVHDVLYEGMGTSSLQFSTAPYIAGAEPTQNQYLAVKMALSGPSILPENVVYFSKKGENDYVWGKIEAHVFCYQYPWAIDGAEK